jgi:hypothetical protein
MDDDQQRLLVVWIEEVEKACELAARLFDLAAENRLPATEARRAAGALREHAGHARHMQRVRRQPGHRTGRPN